MFMTRNNMYMGIVKSPPFLKTKGTLLTGVEQELSLESMKCWRFCFS